MKKGLVLLTTLAFLNMTAQETEAGSLVEDAQIVRMTITLYKDQTKDQSVAWKELMEQVQDYIGRMQGAENKKENDTEIVADVKRFINEQITNAIGNSDIHGEVLLAVSDGRCTDNCAQECSCLKRAPYLCTCSLDAPVGCCNEESRRCNPEACPCDKACVCDEKSCGQDDE